MTLLAIALLAAAQPPATPAWLEGMWVKASESSRQDSEACDGAEAVRYHGDGFVEGDGFEGEWRFEGGRLIEDISTTEADSVTVSRFFRLGPDRMSIVDPDGEEQVLLRCRP